MSGAALKRNHLWIYLGLFGITLAVYFQARTFAFINYDDPDYVTGNPHVREGLTLDGLRWALTSGEVANWFPVTRVSHMLDYQLFGADSGAHHMMSVLLHAVSVLFLFAFLERATRRRWPSAFVALVSAVHPLHVESVAWVAERKDVLCALFWFIGLWAYARYAENPSWKGYLLVAAAFCLGLMSKPMIVTFPFVLMLLDFWPLRRGCRWREKLPFFGLAAISGIVTVAVQKGSGAVESLASIPLTLRLENAAVSYVVYIADTFWPSRLAVFYPYPAQSILWQAVLAGAALGGVSALVAALYRKRPYLAVGWFWYLGTLVPAIGLVQVGTQAHADRYMYVPMVGLAMMLAWGAEDLLRERPRWNIAIAGAAAVVCLGCCAVTYAQAAYWENSETLYRHALAVTRDNTLAEHNLGSYLLDDPARLPEAIEHLHAALRLNPESVSIHSDLGTALAKSGQMPEAIAEYDAALRLDPNSAIVRENLAKAEAAAGPETHYNKGLDLVHAGHVEEAIREFEAALAMRPGYADAENNLGVALTQIPGREAEARDHFAAAVKLDPDNANARFNYGVALARSPGGLRDAIAQLEAAYRLQPDPEVKRALDSLRGAR
jgi:Flp pilus assembly protein TadD